MRTKSTLFLVVVLLSTLSGCALLRPKCPISNCNVRFIHQHAVIVHHISKKELRKKLLEEGYVDKETGQGGGGSVVDTTGGTPGEDKGVQYTTRRHQVVRRKSNNTNDGKLNASGSEDIKKRSASTKPNEQKVVNGDTEAEDTKKKKKKKKKAKNEDAPAAADGEVPGEPGEGDEAGEQVVNDGQGDDGSVVGFGEGEEGKKKKKKKGKKKKDSGMGGERKQKWYRSRVTPWWKNQNPRIGQDWKKPKDT